MPLRLPLLASVALVAGILRTVVAAPGAVTQYVRPLPGADSLGVARLVATVRTNNPYQPVAGTVSPDGRRFAFVPADPGATGLRMLDLTTGVLRTLAVANGERRDLAWSPDGRRIAYVGRLRPPGFTDSLDGIWTLDLATGRETRVVAASEHQYLTYAAWMRDGSILSVEDLLAMGSRAPAAIVRITDPSKGATRVATKAHWMRSPSVSPDGKLLAFIGASCGDRSRHGLRVLDLPIVEGAAARCVGASQSYDEDAPAWSRNGREFYVVDQQDMRSALHVVAFDVTSGVRRDLGTLGVAGTIRGLDVTDDGRLMVVAGSGALHVGIVPATGGTPAMVQRDSEPQTLRPQWSTDGGAIAALSIARYDWERWSRAKVGTLRATSRNDGDGEWRADSTLWGLARAPDGRCVASERYPGYLDSTTRVMRAMPAHAPFAQLPHTGTVEANDGYFGRFGTHWSALGTRLLKQSEGAIFVAERLPALGDTLPCRLAPSHRVVLRGFKGTPVEARLSPDGRLVAFSRAPSATEVPGVFVVPSTGGMVRTLRLLPHDLSRGGPDWSADSRYLYAADADAAGHYRILRLALADGAVDTITRGDASAMHPRVSPDGRRVAVTMATTAATIWQAEVGGTGAVPVSVSRVRPAEVVRVVSPDTAAPDARLLDLVTRIDSATRSGAIARTWPGYWSDDQPYLLYAPTSPGALLVARDAPLPGFRRLPAPGGFTGPLSVYWRPGTIESPSAYGVPYAVVAPAPARGATPADDAAWRTRVLYDLFAGPGNEEGLYGPDEPRYDMPPARDKHLPQTVVCMSGLPSSCVAARRLERAALEAALAAPGDGLRRAVQRYVALRWIRQKTGGDEEWGIERLHGLSVYAARRSALVVAGADTAAYAPGVIASQRALAVADTGEWATRRSRATITGQALAVLLDRVSRDWKRDVVRGDDPLDALARAVRFDSTRAVAIAKDAARELGLRRLLAESTVPSDTTKATRLQLSFNNFLERYYLERIARAVAPDSSPLIVLLPSRVRGRVDTTAARLRVLPGVGDSVVTREGATLLPRPDLVSVDMGDVHITVRDLPVFIEPTDGGNGSPMYAHFFLPPGVRARVTQQAGATRASFGPRDCSAGRQRIEGRTFTIDIGPEAKVDSVTTVGGRLQVSSPTQPPGPRRVSAEGLNADSFAAAECGRRAAPRGVRPPAAP